jgi:hypothetical protein
VVTLTNGQGFEVADAKNLTDAKSGSHVRRRNLSIGMIPAADTYRLAAA